jgi:serine/threonine protein kinase
VAAQLASAISAVHSAGKVHCDIKPSNVLVTRGGRVVLLDFGLAAAMRPHDAKTYAAGILLGTRGYMSPEQARGESLTTASDWYSFGVTLFECITGRWPFDDPRKAFQTDPGSNASRHARVHVPTVPPDLDELIAGLLHPDAASRPEVADVMRSILGHVLPPPKGPTLPSRPAGSLQNAKLDNSPLERAFARFKAGGTGAVVHVRGSSPSLPSVIARRLVLEAEQSGALVLRGRCHPRESVAFNALDGIIDDLTHVLEHSPADAVQALTPKIVALSRVFPVLRCLDPDTVDSTAPPEPIGEPDDAGPALRSLLRALSDLRPLVIWIDNAQWGDRASGELLTQLLRSPEAPKFLVLLSYCDAEVSTGGMLAELAGLLDRLLPSR